MVLMWTDYDPESNVVRSDNDQSGDESSDNEPVGTEHYVAGLNIEEHECPAKPLTLKMTKKIWTRTKTKINEEAEDEDDVSSDDYEDAREQFDDPDAADLEADQHGQEDDEIDSDAIVGEEDWEEFKKFANGRSNEDEEEDDEDSGEEEWSSDDLRTSGFIDDEAEESVDDEPGFSNEEDGLSDDGSADDSDDDDGEEDEDEEQTGGKRKSKRPTDSGIAASVKEMMGEQSVVKSLLRIVDADVQKGKAVQRQRKGFDALLNVRIRLQKSIVAINSFNYADKPEDQTTEPYESAERSALQLWNALDDFRTSIHKGKKRKHAETEDASITALWDRMEAHEKYQSARRKQVLEKARWSRDAKKTSITAGSGIKFTRNTEKPLTAMLSAELDAPERLIKRTRTPRSCAPYHVAQKINEDESIYDDADFYQSLLKELVNQRSGDGSGTGLQAATIRYATAKEAKAKRHVDTKASKGRKMRFVPIPNFMAPEDRRGWEQSAIDRFFGTLFGQKMALNEEEEESSDEEMGGVSVEDQGLRLFRN
ncbi:hypothetical protein RRF57_012004 [Xylaria bambusicola]|uniref:Protein BFR2 n=1 Tax=Xylaria bambusicola TaxID=326684 RepID=A0AAN7ZAD2_9PEZI